MWTVDHIKVLEDGVSIAFAFTKIGHYVQNPPEEVFFMKSSNLLFEKNASAVTWTLLPEKSDHGLKAPAVYDPNTTVMEEGHLLPLQRGGCYAMARTDKGFIAAAQTNDSTAASGWTPTKLARFWDPRTAVGTPPKALADIPLATSRYEYNAPSTDHILIYATGLKNSRGPFTPKRQPNGQYLLIWYNNQADRDPYFLAAGVEAEDGSILWSQPELVLFDRVHSGYV